MFGFYDTDGDWLYGDFCSLIMYDSGTEIVHDDKIVYSRYEGYMESFEEINKSIER